MSTVRADNICPIFILEVMRVSQLTAHILSYTAYTFQ